MIKNEQTCNISQHFWKRILQTDAIFGEGEGEGGSHKFFKIKYLAYLPKILKDC